MSSVLHPTGPEPPQTYWVRRALVIGSAIVALIVLIAVIVSQNSDGSVVVQGSPSPVEPSPAETMVVTPTPTDTASPSASATSATPTATGEASGSATATATASASAEAGSSASAKAKAETEAKTQAEAEAKAKRKTDTASPSVCPAAQLRATLTGKQKLKPKQANTFKISFINGSDATCFLDVSPENFQLKIYSGNDRIWSSKDCTTSVQPLAKKLAKEEAGGWSMTWDGRRSAKGCKTRPEVPRAGTYVVTAQLEGAKPVQLRMVLR